jgi:hypothetical protein
MEIAQAQEDVRETFLGGFAGQFVSGTVWLLSSVACTWHSFRLGESIAIFGGFLIFPLTQLLLRSMGHAYALPKGHPMNALGIQVAFTVGATLPVVIGIAMVQPRWFYPALMIIVGAHYLPFIFMYGMGQFGALSALLTSAGVLFGLYGSRFPVAGGWFTSLVLFVFAFVGLQVARAEASSST